MARHIQADLFAAQPKWLATVMARLPAYDFLSTTEVAQAFGVSSTKVTEWIEEGRLESANLNAGTDKKAFLKIPRTSVIAFAESIAAGI